MAEKLNAIRCKYCKRLLAWLWVDKGQLEIRCHRCKQTNIIAFTVPGETVKDEQPKKGKK